MDGELIGDEPAREADDLAAEGCLGQPVFAVNAPRYGRLMVQDSGKATAPRLSTDDPGLAVRGERDDPQGSASHHDQVRGKGQGEHQRSRKNGSPDAHR
jgi:hypothetical protein